MLTIALIDPSPTARATLAAGLRSEFAVLEGGALVPSIVSAGARLIIASAGAVNPKALAETPFAALPCLILGSFQPGAGERSAPLVVVESSVDSAELLRQVRALLGPVRGATGTGTGGARNLRPPFHPMGLAVRVQRAARGAAGQIPILVTGERGTGKRTVARTLHGIAAHGTLFRVTPLTADGLVDGRTMDRLGSGNAPVTLIADDVDAFSGEAQCVLAECLVRGDLSPAGGSARFWLIATTTADLCGLAHVGQFDSDLAARLSEVVIELTPLRERTEDVVPIAREVLGELGEMLRSPISLSPEGVARLEDYPWPGNLAELLAVLRRTAMLTDGGLIGGGQMAFSSRDIGLSTAQTGPEDATDQAAIEKDAERSLNDGACRSQDISTSPSAAVPQELELILTELAHELKNPMVTIKTFAQHLPTLLEDEELRERFSVLTDEAIGRMDSLLENLLDFARLGNPRPEAVSLTVVLDGVLAEISEKIEQRGARVRREGWDLAPHVVADEGQLAYGLRNLFDSLASELPRHHELAVRVGDNGTIGLRFMGTGGVTEKLQGFLCDGPGVPGPAALPLRFRLARAVIARNGGEVAVVSGNDGETVITVALPGCTGDEGWRARNRGGSEG